MANREPTLDELNGVRQDTVQWPAKAHRVTQIDAIGNEVDDQNPASDDGDSVYCKDIWAEQSNMNNFSGDVCDLFDNLHSIVIDESNNNPKEIFIHFNRTTPTTVIGIGAFTGNFSNIKISALVSGPIEIPLIDESSNDTKYTSRQFDLPSIGFNALRIQFYTDDPVSLSNIFIAKSRSMVARIQGQKPDGTFIEFQATQAGNFKMSLEELENQISSNNNSQLNVTPFHADGTEGALLSGLIYVDGKSGIDSATEALETIDYEHHEIHSGNHYNYCDYSAAGLASGVTIDFTFTTPDTTEWTHLTFAVFSATGATIELFEGSTGVSGGTVVIPRNNNRNSLNTSNVTLLQDPTIVSDGIRAAGFLAGAGREAGFIARGKENILKQNTTYLVRITTLASQNHVSWCGEWYEHINKN